MQGTLHRKVHERHSLMKDLNEALAEISTIRSQIARATEFRGYGPATVAMTGLVAIAVASMQRRMFPDAVHNAAIYITIWSVTAVFATGIIGLEMIVRSRTIHSGLATEMILNAVEQLVPSGVAGVLVATVLIRVAPDAEWMIPGLWQVILSLGVFASTRFLPRAVLAVAAWYLLAGLVCLVWSAGARTLSPWAMGMPFGVGQILAAAILRWSSEDSYASTEES
jgi:hypothetical protein